MKSLFIFLLAILFALTSCTKRQNQAEVNETQNNDTTWLIVEYDPIKEQIATDAKIERIIQELDIHIITHDIIKNDKATVAKLVEYPFPQPYPLMPAYLHEVAKWW